MAAHQAPLSLGFSRQEHWSGLPFPSPMHESEKWKWSRSVVSNSSRPRGLQPTRLLHPWDFPGTAVPFKGWEFRHSTEVPSAVHFPLWHLDWKTELESRTWLSNWTELNPWTTWVWTAQVHLQVVFFFFNKYIGIVFLKICNNLKKLLDKLCSLEVLKN